MTSATIALRERMNLLIVRLRLIEAPPGNGVGDWSDHVLDDSLANEAFLTRERVAADIAACETALERIAEGTYGTCDQCERPIAPKRLKAIPEALTCIACANGSGR